MNIIFVSGATVRARTLTLDWRHWALGGFSLLLLFLSFTLLFNYVTLRYAAAINHPLLQAIVLADQREEAQKTQEVVQGHVNAMAVKLGELQAQMLRLDGLGERLAKLAGLNPQELPPPLEPGTAPGRGGRTACCRKHEFGRTTIGDGDPRRQCRRQDLLDALLQCKFALPALEQLG